MYFIFKFVRSKIPNIFLVSVTFTVSLLLADGGLAQKKNLDEIRRAAEKRYLADSDKETEHHKGNYSVEEDEVIDANIVVTDGVIEIDGEVKGTVIVIEGDLYVNRLGIIRGDAIAISGDIIRRTGAVIAGDEIETSWRNFVRRSDRTSRRWSSRADTRTRYGPDNELFDDDEFLFRYNRVEGMFLGTNILRRDWVDARILRLYGDVGYGFKSKKWRYTAGLERRFFNDNPLTIGIKGYDLTDSDDYWRIGHNENTLAALFLREDFLDFYNRKGFTTYIGQEILDAAFIQLEYRSDEFESMPNAAKWSFFGGNKVFRHNPSISEGESRSVNFYGLIDTRNGNRLADKGWWIQFESEYTSPDLGGDFDYERYILDIRRYQPLTRFENINFRLRLGSSRGIVPIQRRFYLGGISSLRALNFKEFSGRSMFLANIEYLFDPGRILTGPTSWFLEDFNLVLFFDAGAVTEADINHYFDELKQDIFKHNVGVGLETHDGDLRVDLAWRTDQKDKEVRATLRINRSF